MMKRLLKILGIGTVVGALALTAGSFASPHIAWRVRLVAVKLSGRIPEIPLTNMIRWMRPGSPVNLNHLAYAPNVNASIANLLTDGESAAEGQRTFARVCAQCHGDDARGRTGPNLLEKIVNLSDWQFLSTVKWGKKGTMMVGQSLSDTEIWQVGAFLRTSSLHAATGLKVPGSDLPPHPDVTPDMLLAASSSGEWLTYAGNYAGHRHSPLTQINRTNVRRLRLAWAGQLPSDGGYQESTPIVVGRRMFVTQPPEGVTALDARTGAVLWAFHRQLPPDMPNCCGRPNRGVAVLGKYVYVQTFDSHLIALDAATGAKVWDVETADFKKGFTMTSAPLAMGDALVVGVAGGDFGIRGFLAAYGAADGVQRWRFQTIPGPGEPGHETWDEDSWEHGGVATWVTGAYDPELGLVYWGTGNPDPVYNNTPRPGTNLYSCSVIAVDAKTGKLRWHYQFTPSDDHGWDATQQPVLAEITWQGEKVPAILWANRNGFFYALDRRTGKFLYAKAFATQTWASGFTPEGAPIVLDSSHPTKTGAVVSPASNGATSWWPPSYDAKRNLVYVPSADTADIYFNVDNPEYHEGLDMFLGSGFVRANGRPTALALRAIDAATGERRWDTTLQVGGGEVQGEMGGVLSTDGDLVFTGHAQQFEALDADTGKVLWKTTLGGIVHAAPISYSVDGRQYVAIFAGRILFVFEGMQDEELAGEPAAEDDVTPGGAAAGPGRASPAR
jgi:alcohol dehydrogenase (cytochrome c)